MVQRAARLTSARTVGTRTVAGVIAAVAVGGGAGAAIVQGAQRGDGDGILVASLALLWAVAGGVAATRRHEEPFGAVILGGTALGVVALLAGAIVAAPRGDWSSTARDAALLVQALAVAALPALGFHILAGLGDGRLHTRGRRVAVGTGYVAGLALGVVLWAERPDLSLWPVAGAAGLAVAAGYPLANIRYRRAGETEQRRLMWLGWSVTAGGTLAVAAAAMHVLVGWPPHPAEIAVAATAPVPVAVVLGTSRRMRGGIDRVLAATIPLSGLTVLVVGVYLLVVLGLGRVPEQHEGGLLLLSMVAAAIAALAYPSSRRRLVRFADRCVYGARARPDDTLRIFGTRLSRAVPLDELLLQMAESLQRSLALKAAEVWTGSDRTLDRTIAVPERGPASLRLSAAEEGVVARAGVCGPAWLRIWLPTLLAGRDDGAQVRVAPLAHSGELLGLIVVERSPEAAAFADADERLLADLARQAALALHNLHLDSALQASLGEVRRQAHELQASRQRIVTSGDAERRRIERNLHDGAQQQLVALAVKLGLARQMLDRDVEKARTLLEQAKGDVTAAVDELRALAHGIYPPLLMDRGLTAALSAAAQRAALPTDVAAATIGRHAQELEAAVYFCCLEAMQNAGKHAGAGARCTVSLREEHGALRFEVADDGAGFDAAVRATGAGFVNMGDRVGAMGGSLVVESARGRGTRVYGTVPITAPG